MGKCPKCEKLVSRLKMEAVGGNLGGAGWNCVTYLCPFCNTILGAQIDPIAIKTDTVRAIKRN